MNARRFAGITGLVTGAGGDIGAATARRMAAEGADLVLFDRIEELLAATVAACERAAATVLAFAVDQTDRARVEEAVGEAWQRSGRVGVAFANAGYGRFAPFLSISERDWHRHVDVNLSGTFHACQALARRMPRIAAAARSWSTSPPGRSLTPTSSRRTAPRRPA